MDLVSKREFARRVGVSHTAVNKAVETGRLCYANGTRLLDYEKARGQWFDGSDVSKMTEARLSEFEKQRAAYLKDTRAARAAGAPVTHNGSFARHLKAVKNV